MNLKRSARSARGPSTWAHLVWKHWCHKQNRENQQLASKDLQQSHTFVRLCHQFLVQVHPVLLDPNLALPLPPRSLATFKPSSDQLRCWKWRCFGTLLLNILATDLFSFSQFYWCDRGNNSWRVETSPKHLDVLMLGTNYTQSSIIISSRQAAKNYGCQITLMLHFYEWMRPILYLIQ